MKWFKKLKFRTKLLAICLVLISSIIVATLAKYVIEEYHDYFLNAKHFYFTSNRLKKDNPTYLINNWSGVGSFDISFDLLAQKNELVYSEYDIPYTVSFVCPNDVTCALDKTSGTIYYSSINHSDTVTLSVNPSRNYNENERLSIQLIATSTSPYVETIRATFEYVVGKQGVTYEIEDTENQVYLLLKITNAINYCRVNEAFSTYRVGDFIDNSVYRTLDPNDKPKCIGKKVDLTFDPNVLLLDTTQSIIKDNNYTSTTINGVSYVNTLSFNIEPVSTVAVKFYKKNVSNNYTYPITNPASIIGVNIHD
jgi:hypothetical protein